MPDIGGIIVLGLVVAFAIVIIVNLWDPLKRR